VRADEPRAARHQHAPLVPRRSAASAVAGLRTADRHGAGRSIDLCCGLGVCAAPPL
jgi:hypothetical protein